MYQLYFISKITGEDFKFHQEKNIAAVARGIDETSNSGRTFYFYNLFSQSATLPVYLFVSSFANLHFLSYYFSALNIFQGFRLSFARTLGRAVDKLLNGSRVTSPEVYLRAIEHFFRV